MSVNEGFSKKKKETVLQFISLFTPPSCWVSPSKDTFIVSPIVFFFFYPSRRFHLTISFYSALHPHQRSSCSSPQPTAMFDIPSFKPHQERGHLKTWACVIIFGGATSPTQRGDVEGEGTKVLNSFCLIYLFFFTIIILSVCCFFFYSVAYHDVFGTVLHGDDDLWVKFIDRFHHLEFKSNKQTNFYSDFSCNLTLVQLLFRFMHFFCFVLFKYFWTKMVIDTKTVRVT